VHLIAQAKPKEPTPEEKKDQAITQFTTILTAEKITPDLPALQKRIDAVSTTSDTTEAIAAAISTHLSEDLKLEKETMEKVLDEAKAALGLADVGKVAEPEVLENGDVEAVVKGGNGTTPVLIKDVHAWKTGLQMSTGVRPVRDLAEFVEDAAKL
jgi:insulysin